MAIKDLDTSENMDRDKNKKIDEDWKSHHTSTDRYPDEAKGIGETDVKNANASGDGSFGRNDEKVSDGEEEEKIKDNPY